MVEFFQLSFQVGFNVAAFTLMFFRQTHYLRRATLFDKLPAIIAFLWCLTCAGRLNYLIQWDVTYQSAVATGTISAILDIITKALILYFASVRLMMMESKLEKSFKNGILATLGVGFLFSFIANIILAVSCFSSSSPDLARKAYYAYISADIFISVTQLFVYYYFMKSKFDLIDYQDVMAAIQNIELTWNAISLFVFLFLNVLLLIVGPNYIDFNMLFYTAICSVKYGIECDTAVLVLDKSLVPKFDDRLDERGASHDGAKRNSRRGAGAGAAGGTANNSRRENSKMENSRIRTESPRVKNP